MEMKEYVTLRMVKSEDLNHHQTLFAGRGAEWFVESGFIAASSIVDPRFLVCVKIHGMRFRRPVRSGETVCFTSRVAHAGRTSLVSHVRVTVMGDEETVVEGFVSFVHVDASTRPVPHGIVIEPATDEQRRIAAEAAELARSRA